MASPVHQSIFLVDVERYGAEERTTPDRVALRAGLHDALEAAFGAAGLPWDHLRRESTGDGVFVLVPAAFGKAVLVERLPPALVEAVRAHNAANREQARMRLRLALHAGEVTYDAHGVTAPAITKAFRLLDAPELKTALAESNGVLVAVTSAWFFDEVVRHSTVVDAATFRRVRVEIKETSEDAWIARPDDPYAPEEAALFTSKPRPWRLRAVTGAVAVLEVAWVVYAFAKGGSVAHAKVKRRSAKDKPR